MEYGRQEIELALTYAEFVEITAALDPEGSVVFRRSPLPEGIGPEMAEEINFVADYYQRMIFNGDLDPEEEDPTLPVFEDPLAEINFKLKRYQSELVLELKKSLGVADHRNINPYARVMLQFAAEVHKKKT